MNVSYSKILPHAFVVDGCQLKKLTKLLQDHFDKVEIRVDCADDFSREFRTVDDLINYENPKSKKICRLRLSARSDDHSQSATITFPDFSKRGILVDFISSEDSVYTLQRNTLDIITGMCPWYSILARINSPYGFSFVFAIMYVALRVMSLFVYKVQNIIVPLIVFILTLMIVILLSKLCQFLFPPAAFKIGQGKSRFKVKERIQWGIVISSLVSLATGLIIWLITLSS